MRKNDRIATVKPEAGELTIDQLRDLHRKLGYLGHCTTSPKTKEAFFVAQKEIEGLISWEER